MALIERLIGRDQSESEGGIQKIGLHALRAACYEVLEGNISRDTLKAAFAMSAADSDEYDLLLTVSGVDLATKKNFLERLFRVCAMSEARFPGYILPSEIRGKLGI